eukprot:TRINITY_DN5862_c0_g2_i6.p1 TRINITY_DN5862_c0_g2~~TRINITY_DN5862_c0_g2_i6.p1  ORF type:complete len:607 (+),score=144.59 TRINITY_DN5862_c0_g2_i6:153-1823(+)
MESNEVVQEAFFHGTEYLVTISNHEESIRVMIEEKYTGNTWKGEFTSKYVEDITQKTGSFKKFPVFAKMLCAALKQENDSVYLDVLTTHDLELLKSRKTGSALSNSHASVSAARAKEKRYLILTLKGEFEKVHYPLPLGFEEAPSSEMMKSTISRLARELEHIKSRTVMSESGIGTPKSIKSAFGVPVDIAEENEMLKRRLALLENKRIGGAVEMDYLTRELMEKETDYEKNLKNTDKELASLKQKLSQTEREAEETKRQLFNTKRELEHFDKTEDYEEMETLRTELGELSSGLQLERQESRTKIENNKKLLNSTVQDIGRLMDSEKKLKQRMTQLEKELEQVLKRPSYTPVRYNNRFSPGYNRVPNRYYSPSTNVNNARRGNSVPTNRYNNTSKRTTPIRNNSYTRPQPPKNPFRPRYSPVPASKPAVNDKSKNAVKRNYSPSNRLYSPSGAPRTSNRTANARTMGAVDRVSPLRNLANQKPKVPPAVGVYRKSPGVGGRTSNSPAPRGNVFDRLSGGSAASRAANSHMPRKEAKKAPANTQPKVHPSFNLFVEC